MMKSWRMRLAGHVARTGEKRNAYRILVESQKERDHWEDRGVGVWVDNIRMYLREIEWDGLHWIHLARDEDKWRALVKTVMNLRLSKIAGTFLSGCTIGHFSRRAQLRE
jgi:hypothetical protein